MSDAVNKGVEVAGKTAGMVVDYGMLVMVGAVVLVGMGGALYLTIRYWNRKISGEYIPVNEVEEWLKKNKPQLIQLKTEDLPDLRKHRFFTEATRQMRAAEGTSDKAERDLAIWTIRGYRDAILDILEEAYCHKEGFDKFIGDVQSFRNRFDSAITEASSAIKYRLVSEYGFPQDIFAKWQQDREFSDELMTTMLDVASERLTPYERVQSALDSQYARIMMMRRTVNAFCSKVGKIEYNPPSGSDASTISGMRTNVSGSYPAALFERNRRI